MWLLLLLLRNWRLAIAGGDLLLFYDFIQVCHLVAKIGLKIRMQLSCKDFCVLLPADF